MARMWTSRSTCEYIDDYVDITVDLPNPIPEPDYDKMLGEIETITRDYAVDQGGIVGREYRIDEDLNDDNPTVIRDGLLYVSFTGKINIFCRCEHRKGLDLSEDIGSVVWAYGGLVSDYDSHGAY